MLSGELLASSVQQTNRPTLSSAAGPHMQPGKEPAHVAVYRTPSPWPLCNLSWTPTSLPLWLPRRAESVSGKRSGFVLLAELLPAEETAGGQRGEGYGRDQCEAEDDDEVDILQPSLLTILWTH